MRIALALLLSVTLVAVLPATAVSGPACADGTAAAGCCGSTPEMPDCPATGCATAGAALPVASPERGYASLSDAPGDSAARLAALPARAPDTAPPKPVV